MPPLLKVALLEEVEVAPAVALLEVVALLEEVEVAPLQAVVALLEVAPLEKAAVVGLLVEVQLEVRRLPRLREVRDLPRLRETQLVLASVANALRWDFRRGDGCKSPLYTVPHKDWTHINECGIRILATELGYLNSEVCMFLSSPSELHVS